VTTESRLTVETIGSEILTTGTVRARRRVVESSRVLVDSLRRPDPHVDLARSQGGHAGGRVIVIYRKGLGGVLPCDAVSKTRCQVALIAGRGRIRQCSRSPSEERTSGDGETVGMCKQHAAKWDAWLASRKVPK
jgi:hypothetical protein